MSSFLRLFNSGGQNAFELGHRGYEPVENGHTLSPGDPRRKSLRAKRCKPVTIATLIGLLFLLVILYFQTRDKLSHYGTAIQCKMAVSRTDFPNTPTLSYGNHTDESNWAKVMSAGDLIRKLESGDRMDTKILHQSWKDEHLPERFKAWSEQWRKLHGKDWT